MPAFNMSRRFIGFFPNPEIAGEGRDAVDGAVRTIPHRSASHATAVCTGWAEDCRVGPPPSTPERGPPGPLKVFVFRTARLWHAHDQKNMSGPGGPRSED